MLIYYGLGTRRGKDLCHELNGHYFQSNINLRQGNIIKAFDYFYFSIKDIIELWKLHPHIIIIELAQSVMMLFVANGLRIFVPTLKIVPDCHTASYIPNGRNFIGFTPIKKKLVKRCKAIILHNKESMELGLHKNQFVIESKIPDRKVNSKGKNKNITFITSCNPDEPIELIFEVSKHFGKKFEVYFTGDYNKINKILFANKPDSIIGTGYLSDINYDELIGNSLVLVVLTERDYTLLYGGREAIAYNIPVVLSKNNSNSTYFNKGVVLVNNSVSEIVNGINYAIENNKLLKNELNHLFEEKTSLWDNRINQFNQFFI